MSRIVDAQLKVSGPWPQGVNNLASEGHMPADENGLPTALREAVNVDLTDDGVLARREGYAMLRAGQLSHSLWAPKDSQHGLFVDGGELHVLYAGGDAEPLGVQVGDLPLSYATAGDRIYFSNRAVCGMLTPDLAAHPWAPEHPVGQPDAVGVEGYGLNAGTYQVAVTFIDALGRESGAALAATVGVPAGGGIALTSIPQPQAASIAVYVSDANDQVLRRYATLPAGTTELQVVQPAQGRALQTQRLTALPPGQYVVVHNGRQYVASGRRLYFSPALRYGMTDRARMAVVFADDIDMVLPVAEGAGGTGLFVAAGNRTFFLGGDTPEQFARKVAYGAGAVPGSATVVSGDMLGAATADPVPVWLSRDGSLCIGGAGGNVQRANNGMYAIDAAQRAAPMLSEQGGTRRLVFALRGARMQGLAVADRAVAHVIHTAG